MKKIPRFIYVLLPLLLLVSGLVSVTLASAHERGNIFPEENQFITVFNQRLVAPGVLRVTVEYLCQSQFRVGYFQGSRYVSDTFKLDRRKVEVQPLAEVNVNEAEGLNFKLADNSVNVTGNADYNNDSQTDQNVTLTETDKDVGPLPSVRLVHDEETFTPICDGRVHLRFLFLFAQWQRGLFDVKDAVIALPFRSERLGRLFILYITSGELREFIF